MCCEAEATPTHRDGDMGAMASRHGNTIEKQYAWHVKRAYITRVDATDASLGPPSERLAAHAGGDRP